MVEDCELDAMLSAPLAEVPDDGFSARVLARTASRASWRDRVTLFAPVAAVAAVLPFVPGAKLTDAALHVTPLIANSAALSLAAAAIVLTLSLDARLRE
jgi:hypothetical protein